jgi:hypothetical protein
MLTEAYVNTAMVTNSQWWRWDSFCRNMPSVNHLRPGASTFMASYPFFLGHYCEIAAPLHLAFSKAHIDF